MAIKREILEDVTEYKTTVIGPLTLRNLICCVLAGITAIPLFLFLRKYFIQDFSIVIAAIPAVIFLGVGFFPIYGIPAEKFIYKTFRNTICTPYYRKYKTEIPNQAELVDEPLNVPKLSKKERKARDKEYQELGYIAYK